MNRIGDRAALEAFVRSVELGSFSAAARERRLSASTLSKLVTRLEGTLRARLLLRSTRKLALTPEGELFFARCRRILDEFEDAETEISRSRERPRGRLRVHVGVGFAMHQVVPALPRFLDACPEVQLELLIEDRDVTLAREDVDISVRPGPPVDDSLVSRAICEFERVVCAAPAYLERYGQPASPDELARHRCIMLSGFSGLRPWTFAGPTGSTPIDLAAALKVNNADAALRLALRGAGIVRLNEFIVADALHAGTLVPVLADFHDASTNVMLALHPRNRHRLPRVAAMLDFLVTEFSNRPWRASTTPGRTQTPSESVRKTRRR